MKKKSIFQVVMGTVVVLAFACSSPNKMLKNAAQVRYNVTPDPLEMKGDSVDVSVSVVYPAKYFNKNAVMVLTPVLKSESATVAYPEVTLQGEKVQGNGGVISAAGGSYTYTGKVPYQDALLKSELMIQSKVSVKSKSVNLPEVKIADGVLATASLLKNEAQPIEAMNQFKRSEVLTSESEIVFSINNATVQSKELSKQGIKDMKTFAKNASDDSTMSLKGVSIVGYASPDGPEDGNESLAKNRQAAAEKALKSSIKASFEANYTAEDWDGFRMLMESSSIQDKDAILNILSQYSDPVVRESEIKKMGTVYKEIADEILPQLRRSKIVVSAEKVGKSDTVLLAAGRGKSDVALTEDEYLFAATIAENADDAEKILKNGASSLSNSWKIVNNLGCVQMDEGKFDDAQASFARADELSDGDKAVKNNMGVLAVKQGDLAKGFEYFEIAQGAGPEVKYNMGTVKVKEGDYSTAVEMFGSNKTFNAALAKLLAGDVDGALSVANEIEEPDASVDYLKAVIGARQKNYDMIMNNLKSAIDKDAAFKDRAKKDLEFADFSDDSAFEALVK
ncbi:MAG: DUF3868 domain-containing protein [Bacteroidales bacterium]|nr:DUF3868 domain-containing protein [Bacteroidales bacterium]MBR7035878.1 DUF3868 domain-containing protein [Bacteroidales bacterium]